MQEFDKSRTKQNLARAFAGECQDGARYQFMATLAQDEGYNYMQTIFKTHAKNEMAHAERFFNLIPSKPFRIMYVLFSKYFLV